MKNKNIQKAKTVCGDMMQNCTIVKNSAIAEINQLMKNGDISGVVNLLNQQRKIIGTYHPDYPDYSIEFKNVLGTTVPYSKPITPKALEKFPPSIKGRFKISEKYSDFKSMKELFSYSYRTQTDIEINMLELKKMLGDREDPYQQEIISLGDLSAGKWVIKPKQFPPAKLYKIDIEDSEESLDYILLRVIKITDKNEIIISNSEQQKNIKVKLIFDLINKKIDFRFNFINNEKKSKRDLIKYLKFISQIKHGKKLSIISLKEDIVMASGISGNINYSSGFSSIDNEILFLEDILLIEEKYCRTIDIPELINNNDLDAITYLAGGIRNGIVVGSWDDLVLNLELTKDIINFFKNSYNNPIQLEFKIKFDAIIFGEKFEMPKITKKFKSAMCDDIENIRRKLEVLDIGDFLKVKFIPVNNNEYEDIFDFTKKEIIKSQ